MMQCNHVHEHKDDQHQRQRDHMQRKEAVEGRIGHEEVAPYPLHQVGANIGDCAN